MSEAVRMRSWERIVRGWLGVALLALAGSAMAAPQVEFARTALSAGDVAVVINERDPYSREIGEYYAARRGVPATQVLRVSFEPGEVMPVAEFERVRTELEALVPDSVQAYALAWTRPWRVGCMAVTSAFTFGFDRQWCSAQLCAPTHPSPLFDDAAVRPYERHGVRPAMLLAGESVTAAKAMIERGIAVEGAHPQGRAYLVSTPDAARNVRAQWFDATVAALQQRIGIEVVSGRGIGERADALFYFTGLPAVAELDTLRLPAGALADHLTSFGGVLEGGTQMSALRWLAAGASASYGTAVEPCAHPQKFPVPALVIAHYLSGATALEAYWRSVAWPGEGVFVGDPLARPFAPQVRAEGAQAVRVVVNVPADAALRLGAAASPVGPFRPLGRAVPLKPGRNSVLLQGLRAPYYRAVVIPARGA